MGKIGEGIYYTTMLNIEQFKKVAEQYGINTVYLFGSQYDGTSDKSSDLDLAFLRTTDADGFDVDLLYFDLKEFIPEELDLVDLRKAKLTFAFHIIKNSRILYDHDPEIRTDFEDILIMKYLDFSFVNQLINQEIMSNFVEGESL
jgi:predicted nucleotidyltransferase